MKSKILCAFICLMVILLSFAYYQFFQNPESIASFKQYTSPSLKINKKLVTRFLDGDPEDVKEELISNVLSSLGYKEWQQYLPYIDIILYRENILPHGPAELIIVLNLSKDLSVIAIYESIANEYILTNKLDQLLPVEKIDFIDMGEKNHKLMAVFQTLDERIGAYSYERFVEIYHYNKGSLNNVWNKTLYYEGFYRASWLDSQISQDTCYKIVVVNDMKIIEADPIEIQISGKLEKYLDSNCQNLNSGNFKLLHSSKFENQYHWNSRFNSFLLKGIIGENSHPSIAVLEDMTNNKESLLGFPTGYLKLINWKGEILYLPKEKTLNLFNNDLK